MLKKIIICLLVLSSVFKIFGAQLVILSTNDLHGYTYGKYRGILKLASLIEDEKKKYPADSLLLIDCGDTIQGSFSSIIMRGKLMVRYLNFMKYDAWVLGNHEFDFGLCVFNERIKEFDGAILGANILYPKFDRCKSWKMFELNGVKVALIGVTEQKADSSVLGEKFGFKSAGIIETLQKIMSEVRASKPDLIILAQHQGMYARGFSMYKITSQFPEIDLIIGAHSHVKIPGKKVGSSSWYVQAGKHGEGVAKIIIDYDVKRNKLEKINSEIITVEADTPVSGSLLKYLDSDLKSVSKSSSKKICSLNCVNAACFDSSSIEQKIITKAMLAESKADVAINNSYNSGRKLKGEITITFKDLYNWCRFDNIICTLEINKDVFTRIINEQRKFDRKDYHSVVSYADKVSFKDKSKIKVAFSSYAITGAGGRFPFLRKIAGEPDNKLKNTGVVIRNALRNYLEGKNLTVNIAGKNEIKIEFK